MIMLGSFFRHSWLLVALVLLLCRLIHGAVMCYECSSHTDHRCSDPFDFKQPQNKQPPTSKCEGCCVKLVQNEGTKYESVRRTCTKKIKINLFMVDHVCMLESSGSGHMCFCEEDYCNAAPKRPMSNLLLSSGVLLSAFLPIHVLFLGRGLR